MWVHAAPENFASNCSEMPFLVFWEDKIFLSKMFAKLIVIFILIYLYVCIWTDTKIAIFPVVIAYWSGFGIFKQNRENPDEIGMVGQSGNCNVHVA